MARRKARFTPTKKKKPSTLKGSSPTPFLPQPTYTPQVPPIDPIYTNQLGLNQLGLDQTLAGIEFSRGQIGQEYGFNAQGMLDPSNPYNRATMLQRSYQQGQRGTTNSMAGRGQLYAGAHQRNLDEGTFRYGRDYDSLRRQASSAYQNLTQQQQEAQSGFAQSNLDAQSDSLGRAQDYEPVDPGGPSAQDWANLGKLISKSKPKPKKKQKPGQQNWSPYQRPKTKTRLG